MEFVDFKVDKMGETQIAITEDKFKGYAILVRTTVAAITFDGKYDDKGHPIFGVNQANSLITIPPKVDIRKDMK